jgi:hypothetical protein
MRSQENEPLWVHKEAFGDFDPQCDAFAAVKLALSALASDSRLDELEKLLTDGHPIGAVEGCPGWVLERRDSGVAGSAPGYADWPDGMSYRAYVDPNEFSLRYPEVFLGTAAFRGYANRVFVVRSRGDRV